MPTSKRAKTAPKRAVAKPSAVKKTAKAAKAAPAPVVAAAPVDPKVLEEQRKLIASLVTQVASEEGTKVLESIGDGATDEHIEKQTGLKLAHVRNLLNNLQSFGLVDYSREKNMQTGWFTYTWRVNLDRFLHNVLTARKREMETVRTRLERGDGATLYRCKKTGTVYSFDQAFDLKFKSPENHKPLEEASAHEEIERLSKDIRTLHSALNRAPPAPAKPPAGLGTAR